MNAIPLAEYIAKNYESQAAFARAVGVKPGQVSYWLSRGYVVIDGSLYGVVRPIITEGNSDANL